MLPKILLVEDNLDFRAVVKDHILKNLVDVEIFETSCGDESIEIAKREEPHIVIMDVRLVHMNGIIAAQTIKEKIKQCDIIILSMFNSDEYKKLSFGFNFKAYINKSEVFDRLMPVIRNSLLNRGLLSKNSTSVE